MLSILALAVGIVALALGGLAATDVLRARVSEVHSGLAVVAGGAVTVVAVIAFAMLFL